MLRLKLLKSLTHPKRFFTTNSFRLDYKLPKCETSDQEKMIEHFYQQHQIIASENIVPVKKFTDLKLDKFKMEMLSQVFENPTPIQSIGWPMSLSGRDFVGVSATGSGKTISFGVPMVEHCIKTKELNPNWDGPIALVVAPTRELSQQIDIEIRKLARGTNIKCTVIFGGAAFVKQLDSLSMNPEIVVGTPGRMLHFLREGDLRLKNTNFVVLDEADRMMDMGFLRDVSTLVKATNQNRQLTMWSATWSKNVGNVASEFLNDPLMVKIGKTCLKIPENIDQEIKIIRRMDKENELLKIIKMNEDKKFLIFFNTKLALRRAEIFLEKNSIKIASISGEVNQTSRNYIMTRFRQNFFKILLASDVASRGIDIKDIDIVLNFDMPVQIADYIHRVGRTGRAGKKGKSVTFLTISDSFMADPLIKVLKESNKQIPLALEELQR